MSQTCETVFVKRATSDENPTGLVVVNKTDVMEDEVILDANGKIVVADPVEVKLPEGAAPAVVAPWAK